MIPFSSKLCLVVSLLRSGVRNSIYLGETEGSVWAWPGRNKDSIQNWQKIFSSAHIIMKCLLIFRNHGVHETSVSWPSPDKGQA